MAQSRYLFALSCFQMDLLKEAEAALCPSNEPGAEVLESGELCVYTWEANIFSSGFFSSKIVLIATFVFFKFGINELHDLVFVFLCPYCWSLVITSSFLFSWVIRCLFSCFSG